MVIRPGLEPGDPMVKRLINEIFAVIALSLQFLLVAAEN
jgi:hypothetical protein